MKWRIVTYDLPAYWSSYLINLDASGIDSVEKEQADKFLSDNDLPWPVWCGDSSFSWHNDSGNGLGGEVCTFNFILENPNHGKL